MFPVDEEEEAEEDSKASYDRTVMPEVVVSLEATDSFLKARIMNLPENVVSGTHNTEEKLQVSLLKMENLIIHRLANSNNTSVPGSPIVQ